jgi:hypothetical protein
MTDDMIERVALELWHRFAPDHHIEWAEEIHKAEYLDAARAAIEAYEAAVHPMLENAWEFRGFDANEIIEACARVVDECNREGPYNAIGAASRIRALKGEPPK